VPTAHPAWHLGIFNPLGGKICHAGREGQSVNGVNENMDAAVRIRLAKYAETLEH
jgi:hypothetical protein